MSKRRRKTKPRRQSQGATGPRMSRAELDRTLERAYEMMEREAYQEALELLEPLEPICPRVTEVHEYLAYARMHGGDISRAIRGYERALSLSRDPEYHMTLVLLYGQLEFRAHAVRVLREVLRSSQDPSFVDQARQLTLNLGQPHQHL